MAYKKRLPLLAGHDLQKRTASRDLPKDIPTMEVELIEEVAYHAVFLIPLGGILPVFFL
jgi:hypothetical protein